MNWRHTAEAASNGALLISTHRIRDQLDAELRLIHQVDDWQRENLPDADLRSVQPLEDGLRALLREHAALEQLVRLPEQTANARALGMALNEWISVVRRLREVRLSSGPDALRTEIATGRARAAMDAIQSRVDTIYAYGKTLVSERAAAAAMDAHRARLLTGLGIGLSFSLLLAVFGFGVRESRLRQRSENALRAEEGRQESEERFKVLEQNSWDAVHLLSADGIILYESPAVLRVLGYRPEELVGRQAFDMVHPDDLAHASERMGSIMSTPGLSATAEVRVRHKDGTWPWMDCVATNLLDHPAVRAIAVNYRDITERKETDQRLRASLREKEALLREVHHRVKNNLQVITSLLRLEASRAEETGTCMVLNSMKGRVQSMALLHETLYRSGTFAFVNLGDYLRQLATQSFRVLNTEPGRIQIDLDLASAQVGIDQAIPCGLLLNELISNSLKHGFTDGRAGVIRVELRGVEEGSALRLRVTDTGVGLPEDFKSRSANSLGLQLVEDLAGQLQGSLSIERPATFTLTFEPRLPAFVPGLPPVPTV